MHSVAGVWVLCAAAASAVHAAPTISPLVGIVIQPGEADLTSAAAILKRQIQTRSASTTVELNCTGSAATITLGVDASLGPEAFVIDDTPGVSGARENGVAFGRAGAVPTVSVDTGTANARATQEVTVRGGDARGVLYGVGKLLRTASFQSPTGESTFAVGEWRGSDSPQAPNGFRGMYLATHFQNFYQAAPVSEVVAYIEDLACVWGANTIVLEMPWEEFSGFEDPTMLAQIQLTAALLQGVRGAGLQLGLVGVANQGFTTRPDTIAACYPLPGNHFGEFNAKDPQVSVSKPGGLAYLVANYKELFSRLKAAGADLDIFVSWPYDEGGSACPGDWPWGSTGYLNVSHELVQVGKAVFPQMRTVLSTWGFDAPTDFGEFAGLDSSIRSHPGVFDFVMADGAPNGGTSLPPWPMQHGGPGGLPLLNFPEISMAGREPWGGFGANPQPDRLEDLWSPVRALVKGGMPYSEGIFDDINQAICFQQYWNSSRSAAEIVTEYVGFEYGRASSVLNNVSTAVALLGRDYPMRTTPGPCYRVACGADEVCGLALELLTLASMDMTPEARCGWRWRILLDRAVIDVGLNATGGQVTGEPTVAAFAELSQIYHAQNAYPAVRPPGPSNQTCSGPSGFHTCPLDSARGTLVPWVRSVNMSTVYGTGVDGGPGTPLLGLYSTEAGCQQACESNGNCTQYTWQAGEVCQEIDGQWRCDATFARHCYARCDTVWSPRVVNGSVSAVRVKTK